MRTGRMSAFKGAFMIAAMALASVLCSATPAKANCYLGGYVWMDGDPGPGTIWAYPHVWGEVGNNSPGAPYVEITCAVTGVRVYVYMDGPVFADCYQGRTVDYGCENDGEPSGGEATEESWYSPDGFYGIWTMHGKFWYWTGGSIGAPTTLNGPSFLMGVPYDFGWGNYPTQQECWEYTNYEWREDGPGTCEPTYTPIIVPTSKSAAIKLTDVNGGVAFDWNCDGVLEQTAWTERGQDLAFLAYDKDGNGKIECGEELFGNFTVPGQPNGFAALGKLGGGQKMDDSNPFFEKLLLWTDRNHNGVSEPSELARFGDQFIEVSLGATPAKRKDGYGNEFKWRGWVVEKIGKKKGRELTPDDYRLHSRFVYDVVFASDQK
jgi:hypothetical protein